MKIVITGESPFLESIGELCVAAGHDTVLYVVEDWLSARQNSPDAATTAVADVVIDLVHETAVMKQQLLTTLSNTIAPETLVLSSVLPVSTTQAAAWVGHPERVVGFGLFPPIISGGLVELAAGLHTEPPAMQKATTFWQSIGLEAVIVGDGPGLIRARTVCCIINEAVSALMEGVAEPGDIDQAMRLGTNYPFGPLEWADEVGLDTVLGVMTGLFDEWGEDRYRPSPLLKRMVTAGKLGKKSGEGFYKYAE